MDITSDSSYSILYGICKAGAPDYAMKSDATTKEAASEIPDSLFADSFNRRYPIHSKGATWMSAAYFAKTAEKDGYAPVVRDFVEARIKEAAARYGISKDVEDAMARIREKPAEKRAEDDESNYGWPSERKYPMFDEEGVKLANSYFEENAYSYPPEMRHTIARNIMRKCAEYGIEPERNVRVESGSGLNLRDYIGAALVDRVHACRDPEAADALRKTAMALMDLPEKGFHGMAVKFAEILERWDATQGFDRRYGTRFESPAQIFFGMSTKQASAIVDDTVVLNGNAFSVTKLAELPLEVFTCTLGEDFGERVKSAEGIDRSKLADELHSLPTPDKKALFASIREYAS